MAHNLATINGRVAMAYQGETPWHQLGTRIVGGDSVTAALEAASLNWCVGLQSLYLSDGRLVPNRRAVVRDIDREILGTVSGWYQPIQNADAFNVFQPAMQEFGMTIESAGALGNGSRVWMLFKLPTAMAPIDGDVVNGYGLAVTSHDGSNAYEFRPTPIRVVCQNTLNMAVGKGGEQGRVFAISHIGDKAKQLDQVSRLVRNLTAAMEETGETFAAMARRRMTPAEVVAYVEQVFPASDNGQISKQLADKRAVVADLVWSGIGADLAGSSADGTTAWAAYNAVTEYFDHVATGLAKSQGAKLSAARSAIFGTGADVKQLAFEAARELVAA